MPTKKEIALKKFGRHVKYIRQQKNLTQIDVSSAMGKDQQSLQRVESGNINPSLFYLIELAAALKVTLKELMDF